jgi:hypothetical protein
VLLAGAFGLASVAYAYHLNDASSPVTISVSGEGKVTGKPDIADVSIGVQTDRLRTSELASADLAQTMEDVLAAVRKAGIADADIRTEQLWLTPVYDYTDGRTDMSGFQATQSLQVTVRDLTSIGTLLTAATEAGANQLGSVQMRIDDADALRAKARSEAIAEAKAKADVLAGELGMRVDELVGFTEGMTSPYAMRAYEGKAMAGGMDDMATLELPAGSEDVFVTVSLTYRLY